MGAGNRGVDLSDRSIEDREIRMGFMLGRGHGNCTFDVIDRAVGTAGSMLGETQKVQGRKMRGFMHQDFPVEMPCSLMIAGILTGDRGCE